MRPTIILFFCILQASTRLVAQQFGGFPPSVKWKQIDTDTARIIFPAEVTLQAEEVANILHRIAARDPHSLGASVRKINVVLHNNTTQANGYVALGPFRSEYYLVPGSDIFEFGANPWYRELAVHEYRHVVQYSNFNRGVSRIGSVLFGQQGQDLLNALSIPNWFWEGDAVHAETVLTPQGRGRTPFFFNGYKSLWREGRHYSWMKLRNGSLKDYVPSHYHLGYLLVNYGYSKFGEDFWGKVTRDAAAFKGIVYPFQHAVKKHAGLDFKTLRKQAIDYYSHEVSRKRTDLAKRKVVTNYFFPQWVGQDSLFYVKNSYRSLPAFYIRDNKGEHRLRLKNISSEDWVSSRNGLVAYTAYETDARWSLKDYSTIYLYNIRTGAQKKISEKSKYFTPDISPDGSRLIAVRVNNATATSLELMDLSGTLLKTFSSANSSIFVHPRFIDDQSVVVTERLANSTMQMIRIDLVSGERDVLIPPTSALIGYPFVHGGMVYFTSSLAGQDDIYALRFADRKVLEIKTGGTGRYYPSVSGDSIVWSAFTSNGMNVEMQALTEPGADVNAQAWREVVLPYAVAGPSTNVLTDLSRKFAVSSYSRGAHLFNFHSWRPDYTDPEFTVSLFSDNVLNNFTNEIYYLYNQNETSHAAGFNSSYGGFFTMINAGVEYNWNRSFRDTVRRFDVNQFEARLGYSIPLNLTSGRMYRYLDFGSNVVLNRSDFSGTKDSIVRTRTYLHHFVSWSHYLPRARQHIYPKFGYTLSSALRHWITDPDRFLSRNSQWLLGAQLYLPSVRNHSIVFSGAYQRVDTNSTTFTNRFANSRGYDEYYTRTMWRVSANYHFPIVYPDFGVANIVYLLRVRGNAFYDYTRMYYGYFAAPTSRQRNLRSTGLEVLFDTRFWNQLPVSLGFRVSHLLDNGFSAADRKGNTWIEFILPVNLIPD